MSCFYINGGIRQRRGKRSLRCMKERKGICSSGSLEERGKGGVGMGGALLGQDAGRLRSRRWRGDGQAGELTAVNT